MTLWKHIFIASLPAALCGTLGDKLLERATGKDIDAWLYRAQVVAAALIFYGICFIFVERINKKRAPQINGTAEITPRGAFEVGLFQTLSLIPGTSRSGSTILGACLLGFSRSAAAEFSFLLAIPVMAGAGGVKLFGFLNELNMSGKVLPGAAWGYLAVGCLTSFAVSFVAIRFLTDFVRRHSFAPFGVYRILLGAVVLISVWM